LAPNPGGIAKFALSDRAPRSANRKAARAHAAMPAGAVPMRFAGGGLRPTFGLGPGRPWRIAGRAPDATH